MSILHTIYISGNKIPFKNIDLSDEISRQNYILKTPTITLPFLETDNGNISQTNSILYYIASKYNSNLIGKDAFENAKMYQWIEFASCEINKCQKEIIYPIFGWKEYDKDLYNKANNKIKEYIKIIENELNNKNYLINDRLTLADIVLFRYLRYFLILVFPEEMRNKLMPNVNKWFKSIMGTKEAIKAYGITVLCKMPMKPFTGKIEHRNQNIKKNENKHQNKPQKIGKYIKNNEENTKINNNKKEKNPLDLLPPSKFNLDDFKRSFLNNKNKQEAIKKFWEIYDPEGYSLWWLEYQNLPQEGKVLFRTSNAKNFFLQKLDNFRRYCFAVHGVYGVEGDYKIRGVWMWRGKDIPKEIKENDYYDYLTIRNLDHNNKEDVKLVNDFWTKLNENDKVQGRFAADCSYFN